MIHFVIILIILTACLLIVSTIFQNSKKEGGGNSLGTLGAHQIIGVQATSNFLERSTWVLLVLLFALSIGTFALIKSDKHKAISPNLERIQQKNLFLESTEAGHQESSTTTTESEKTDEAPTE